MRKAFRAQRIHRANTYRNAYIVVITTTAAKIRIFDSITLSMVHFKWWSCIPNIYYFFSLSHICIVWIIQSIISARESFLEFSICVLKSYRFILTEPWTWIENLFRVNIFTEYNTFPLPVVCGKVKWTKEATKQNWMLNRQCVCLSKNSVMSNSVTAFTLILIVTVHMEWSVLLWSAQQKENESSILI